VHAIVYTMASCFNDGAYFILVVACAHILFYLLIIVQIKLAKNNWKMLLSFDASVAIMSFAQVITQQQWVSTVGQQITATVVLVRMINTMLQSSLGILSLVIFVTVLDRSWNAIVDTVQWVADQQFGTNLSEDEALIAICVLVAVACVLYYIIITRTVPKAILQVIRVTLAAMFLPSAVRVIQIVSNDNRSTLYCCLVSEAVDDPSTFDKCPIVWPGTFWFIWLGATVLGIFVSYVTSDFKKEKKARRKREKREQELEKREKEVSDREKYHRINQDDEA